MAIYRILIIIIIDMPSKQQTIKNLLNPNSIKLIVCALLILSNIFYSVLFTVLKQSKRKQKYIEPGTQFANFEKILSKVAVVGYITDKEIGSREKIDEAFLQAQYYLAPSILDVNNKSLVFHILDSTNVEFIKKVVVELKAARITNNEYGQALIVRTR